MDWTRNYTIIPNQMDNAPFGIVSTIVKPECYDTNASIMMTNSETHIISQPDMSNGGLLPSTDGGISRHDLNLYGTVKEDDLKDRPLPDHLKEGLDIVIVGINPSLASAHAGHHYAGPGNHFWTCLTQAGLVPMEVSCHDDSRMLDYGIGFTNVCTRPTKGAAELTRKEMKAGAAVMLEKMRTYKPKIAVFNGKGIYEAYVGHKNFSMGKQPNPLDGTDTLVFVMPSSSARCAQLPRAEDKLPFFHALRKLRDFVRGHLAELPDSEVVFTDYTEFRVTQPDPKSIRKAERRRKRKAEAAAAAAAAADSASGTTSPGGGHVPAASTTSSLASPENGLLNGGTRRHMMSPNPAGSVILVGGVAASEAAGEVGSQENGSVNKSKTASKSAGGNSKRRKASATTTLSSPSVNQTPQHAVGGMSLTLQGVGTAIADPQLALQQQQLHLQHQQHQQQTYLLQQQQFIHSMQPQHQQHPAATMQQHGQALTAAAHPMIVSGGQLMSTGPVVTLSMTPGAPGATAAIPVHSGVPGAATAIPAGCYAAGPQLQFSTGGTVAAPGQQFFISPQATAGTGGQTLLHWSAAPVGTSSATMHFSQPTCQPQQPQHQQQQAQQAQPITWQTIYAQGQQQQQQQQPHAQQVHASAGLLQQPTVQQQQQQAQPQQQQLIAHQPGLQLAAATQQPTQQLLFAAAASSQHPVVSLQAAVGAGTATAYPQQIYVAQAPAGVPNAGGASYHLLPVNCPTSNFTNLLLSDQQQHQSQSAQQLQTAAQCQMTTQLQQQQNQQRGQLQLQQQQQQQQFQQSQQQHIQSYNQQMQATAQQQHQHQQTYVQANQHQSLTDLTGAAAANGSPAQFITLAPGAPLKVMTVGPNGQLIQTMPQFLPAVTGAVTTPIGMTLGQAGFPMPVTASTGVSVAASGQQRRLTTGGSVSVAGAVGNPHLAANGQRTSTAVAPTALFTGPGTIPLVQPAGGEDLLSGGHGGAPLSALNAAIGMGDEKLVYTAL